MSTTAINALIGPYQQRVEDALTALGTDPKLGLSETLAKERLAQVGPNELSAEKPVPAWRKFLGQFTDALVVLLIIAAAISAALWFYEQESALPYEAIAILGVVGVAVMLIYGTNVLSYHELSVAGEVLMSAPSRARRVISDQIIALDLTAQLHNVHTVTEVSEILSGAAMQFGFLGMELTGEDLAADRMGERVLPAHWAWKLDYPIRISGDARAVSYILSIWCSPEQSARPYGAERVARVLGPALQRWFETRADGAAAGRAPGRGRLTPASSRRLRIT